LAICSLVCLPSSPSQSIYLSSVRGPTPTDAIFCVFLLRLCIFSSVSRHSFLKSMTHQDLWNSLVITPTSTMLMYFLYLFMQELKVQILYLRAINNTPTLSVCSSSSEGESTKAKHNFQRYEASIRDIPKLILHLSTLKCLSCHLG
jgi:hypothetical protein